MDYRNQLDFSGHVVAVTGGASGIGLETATAFASCGAAIALLDLGEAALATAAEALAVFGVKVSTHVVN
ncbi:MAG TPA: SDR family NAD(P)-dependent oxidoreductase, partial [Sphingobium sp.]|nr:SDR family NAD(P)-dependent oxidoreductase [Sphingobium sp.]